jgi:hypothetical protein
MGTAKKSTRAGRGMRRSGVRRLDDELARITQEEAASAGEDISSKERARIAREILDVVFNIWIRFAVDLGKELRMSPFQWDFILYDGGKRYRFRESFNFSRISEAVLEEQAFPFRHMLRAELRVVGGRTYVRVSFVLEEGREYERTSTVVARTSYIVYNQPAQRFGPKALKAALAGPLRAWIRSEVRQDPSVLWEYCQDKLRRGR